MIRDYALAASGLLVRKLGGPSVKPYQPEGVWEAVAMIGSNTRDYKPRHAARTCTAAACTRSGSGPPRRRRWRCSTPRTARPAPSAASGPTRRSQALVTLNDVQFVEAARVLAEKAHRRRAPATTPGSTSSPSGCWPARSGRRNWPIVKESLADLLRELQGRSPRTRSKLIAVGESKADPTLDAVDAGRVDDAGERVDEPGRGAEQVTGRAAGV